MVMNLYILFFISLPEALLNLYIMLRLAGESKKLKFKNINNTLRFLITIALMLLGSWIIRPLAPNVVINILLHSIVYTLLISLIYKTNLIKSAFCVSLVLLLYSTVENLYIRFIIAYISHGIENFNSNYQMFIVYSLPYRFAQIAAIIFLIKYEIVLDIAKIDKSFNRLFVICMYLLTCLEYCFSYLFDMYFEKMSLFHQIIFSIAISIMAFITSLLVFKFIYIIVRGLLTGGYKQYQELEMDSKYAFKKVYTLIKDNNINGAEEILENLIDIKKTKDTEVKKWKKTCFIK